MGSITRFINPDAASIVLAREADQQSQRRKRQRSQHHRNPNCHSEPAKRHPEGQPRKAQKDRNLDDQQQQPREQKRSRYCQRGIGEATIRLSSFFCRASTMAKPSPHIAEPIRFIPSSPGTTKSM